MHRHLLHLLASFLWLSLAAADDASAPLTPAEAAKKVNEQVKLQMDVKSATLREGACFLNSEDDFRSANNFTVFLDQDALAKFKAAKIDNPADHFKGKTIQVTGTVTLYRDKPQIKITGPDAVKMVEKK